MNITFLEAADEIELIGDASGISTSIVGGILL